MTRFLARRLAQAVIVIVGVVIVTFAVARLVPGDPAVTYAGPRASQRRARAGRATTSGSTGLAVQLADYVRGVADRRLGHRAAHPPAGARRPGHGGAGVARARDRGARCSASLVGLPLGIVAAR